MEGGFRGFRVGFRILWDLITIPLGIFELPQFIQFLTVVSRLLFLRF